MLHLVVCLSGGDIFCVYETRRRPSKYIHFYLCACAWIDYHLLSSQVSNQICGARIMVQGSLSDQALAYFRHGQKGASYQKGGMLED